MSALAAKLVGQRSGLFTKAAKSQVAKWRILPQNIRQFLMSNATQSLDCINMMGSGVTEVQQNVLNFRPFSFADNYLVKLSELPALT